MNAYHAEMEHVLEQPAKPLALRDGMARLTARVGALHYFAGRLASEAPANQLENIAFKGLLQAVQTSVRDLQSAVF